MSELFKGHVVITGCDSGIGKQLALELHERGIPLILSYVKEDPFPNVENIHTFRMDLTDDKEIECFCNQVRAMAEKKGPISGIIINSGIALGGPIEDVPLEVFRKVFEINYFGAVAMIKAVIPLLAKSKGRIMVIGSMAGKVAMPFLSPYVSTKFALEGFCDSLRREMNPLGISTVLIEPAAVATPIWNKAKEQDVSYVQSMYLESLYKFRDVFIEGGNRGMPVEVAARQIAEIFCLKNPKSRYIIAENALTSRLMTLLPASLIDKAVKKMFNMNYHTGG